ncbi:hypothetical protein MG290_06575 [Flavobacterium sp. CBA20B-1]|uniref:hypothetical protein n=1 Tax=unclassified Flavobacterium TaxID=196869 RepID=UPI002224E967|nr:MULTISPECIES: hypothetical protein [unclassified Flavobacterium]WCM43320.1 hypothetical protein MG290_06575 [Flavobacterium sp. CBA20B-1]
MKKILLSGIMALGAFFASNAQCSTVASINENFDSWKKIDKCWSAESGKSMLYSSEGKITFYSMMSSGERMILSTPKMKAGTYKLTLDISKNSGDASLELFSIGSVSDEKLYVSISKPSAISGTKKAYTINLKNDAHLGFKVLLNGIHQAVYIDNLVLKAAK